MRDHNRVIDDTCHGRCHQKVKRWAAGGRAATAKKLDKNHRAEF